MPQNEPREWLTVGETAERLGTSEQMVRRKIREGKLPASRLTDAARAPWMVNAAALERRLQVEATHKRVKDAGIVTGYGDFQDRLAADAPEAAPAVGEIIDRNNLFARLQAEMAADESLQEQLRALDEEERIEQAAQELARRTRIEERIRRRADEILEEGEDED